MHTASASCGERVHCAESGGLPALQEEGEEVLCNSRILPFCCRWKLRRPPFLDEMGHIRAPFRAQGDRAVLRGDTCARAECVVQGSG